MKRISVFSRRANAVANAAAVRHALRVKQTRCPGWQEAKLITASQNNENLRENEHSNFTSIAPGSENCVRRLVAAKSSLRNGQESLTGTSGDIH